MSAGCVPTSKRTEWCARNWSFGAWDQRNGDGTIARVPGTACHGREEPPPSPPTPPQPPQPTYRARHSKASVTHQLPLRYDYSGQTQDCGFLCCVRVCQHENPRVLTPQVGMHDAGISLGRVVCWVLVGRTGVRGVEQTLTSGLPVILESIDLTTSGTSVVGF